MDTYSHNCHKAFRDKSDAEQCVADFSIQEDDEFDVIELPVRRQSVDSLAEGLSTLSI